MDVSCIGWHSVRMLDGDSRRGKAAGRTDPLSPRMITFKRVLLRLAMLE